MQLNPKLYKSETVTDNGFNPIFNNFKCYFKINEPELAFIIFNVSYLY